MFRHKRVVQTDAVRLGPTVAVTEEAFGVAERQLQSATGTAVYRNLLAQVAARRADDGRRAVLGRFTDWLYRETNLEGDVSRQCVPRAVWSGGEVVSHHIETSLQSVRYIIREEGRLVQVPTIDIG